MSTIREKLLNAEVVPPRGIWDAIASELQDGPAPLSLADKLYNIEVEAPAFAWQKIAASLDGEAVTNKEATTAPVRKMAWRKYAAAAAIIIAVGFAVLRFSNNSRRDYVAVENTAPPVIPAKAPVAKAVEDSGVKTIENNNTPKAADYAHLDQVAKVNMKKAIAQERYELPAAASQALYAYEDHTPSMAERYVMLMTPDGSIIRMSKKMGDFICCVSGEEQSNVCKDQLKKWQETMANSSLAPSPANFLDILSLVNSLEDAEL